jgi:hypothetical protein
MPTAERGAAGERPAECDVGVRHGKTVKAADLWMLHQYLYVRK